MSHEDFSSSALVLLVHGTREHSGTGLVVARHAEELRRRRVFAAVHEAFVKQSPRIEEVLSGIVELRVFIVPVLMSEGYLCEVAVPQELGFRKAGQATFSRVQERHGQTFFYCKPIGTHQRMTNVILVRANEVVEKFPFPRTPSPHETTLLIAGHGTSMEENSRKAVEQHVERIRQLNLFAAVHGGFLEEAPRLSDYHQVAHTRNIIVVPFFLGDGRHTQEDIPVMLGEPKHLVAQRCKLGQPPWRNPTEKKSRLIWYSSPIGSAPQVADVILERVHEATAGTAPGH